GFVRPILAAEWTIAEVPRWAANRLLRVAWHLTSVAWLAFAVIAVDGSALAAISVASLASGVIMLIGLAGHPAWPAFLLAGLSGLHADGVLTTPVLAVGATAAVTTCTALAALHVSWALGGRWMLDGAVPTTADGDPTFTPGPLATLAVAALLGTFGGLVAVAAATDEPWWVTVAVLAGVAVLAIRAIGDGRYAGFTKRERDTRFGRLDDAWFTPLVVLLAIASSASVL
ncbi:MAG: DUF3995 domain-containing protein, partial [Actinomycetota bacterium]